LRWQMRGQRSTEIRATNRIRAGFGSLRALAEVKRFSGCGTDVLAL
jgi:hypothetical protein